MNETIAYQNVHENRKYKSDLFCAVFEDKKHLLELYNAVNPNMPLRGLLYFAKLFERYVAENAINLYSSQLKKIPTPSYIVFYNGTRDEPNEIMSLKQALTLAMEDCIQEGILADILEKQRDEVLGMVLSTFNRELYEKELKEDAREEGWMEGRIEGAREKLRSQI